MSTFPVVVGAVHSWDVGLLTKANAPCATQLLHAKQTNHAYVHTLNVVGDCCRAVD